MRIPYAATALAALLPMGAQAQMAPQPMSNPAQSKSDQQGDLLPDIDAKIGNDAQLTYAHAEKAYENREWLEAIAYYQHLRAKFSYNLPLATAAQLRLGDIAFEREKYLEAKEYYKQFIRMHPNAEKADYAAFRIGLCAYKDIPTDFIFFPPTSERDQTEVRTARTAMADFVQKYPKSEYVPKANEILVSCDNKLADHEMYVADFYAKRGKWEGAANRAEGLARNFPDSQKVTDALLLAIKGRVELKQPEQAQKDYDLLASLNPEEKVLKKAQAALAKK